MKLVIKIWVLAAMTILLLACGKQNSENNDAGNSNADKAYFTNPILEQGADPYVYLHTDGLYYTMVTRQDRLQLWRSVSFTDLEAGENKVIWTMPATGSNSCCIWAPEIHYFDDTWYIYYSATDAAFGDDQHRYVHVMQNTSENPFDDSWEELGKVDTKYPGIDGNVFEYKGTRYFAYSPYIGNQSGIILSKMTAPAEIENEVVLGLPIYDWEKTPPREILEGPQFLEGPGDQIFIIYSAGACWDDNYGLGMFSAQKDADLLDPASWSRSRLQVFGQNPDSSVYGPGHNCFTKSPDLEEDWIVYHAKRASSNECAGRSMRAQEFSWDEDGVPVFGEPYSVNTKLEVPSGTGN
ncbi:MAG: glycoside hydrolase family 43 protein [Bacteroidales bacterium]|nr:glycoside hydrolase family 43 protein [Bacteroidales bacterium]MDT8431930.1 glycoside hydrolase family 43 protein [Bacteroidales bacterium]